MLILFNIDSGVPGTTSQAMRPSTWSRLPPLKTQNMLGPVNTFILFDGSEIPRPTTGWDGAKTL